MDIVCKYMDRICISLLLPCTIAIGSSKRLTKSVEVLPPSRLNVSPPAADSARAFLS